MSVGGATMTTRTMYELEIRHDGLGTYRHIRGSDLDVVRQKASAQERRWQEAWERKQAMLRRQRLHDAAAREKAELRELAEQQSGEAQEELEGLRQTLAHTLQVQDAINWDELKDLRPYPEAPPQLPVIDPPRFEEIPREPQRTDAKYQPVLGFWARLLPGIRDARILAAHRLFEADYAAWRTTAAAIDERNQAIRQADEHRRRQLLEEHESRCRDYEEAKRRYLEAQAAKNEALDRDKARYMAREPGAIIDYCEMVLARSEYPDYFPRDADIEYLLETRTLIVDYALPAKEHLPTLREVRFIQGKGELREVHLSDRERDSLYDDLVYQITLRVLHELFEADVAQALDAVVFNGLVTGLDKATGRQATACILSVQAKKEEFLKVELSRVDPKACFRALKGVGSTKLHSMTPVAPILQISREDRRFVNAYAVADGLDDRTNLASMDWEDFEHLIRELFAKEFSAGGGEVKITQASRDGGVDAVAFDPDPIRGGKIVIQAKRYTNAVGVSAVRDLYGTVLNEGATKGILVTTSDYGPDAYEFVKGKPLTLLSGANLLHLLEKHGHKAKIDLKEAKRLARG